MKDSTPYARGSLYVYAYIYIYNTHNINSMKDSTPYARGS